jgi:predicted nuclease of predicted toxin-antitoxin system
MRILIDEDLDIRLRKHFSVEHKVVTVGYRGWKGYRNGRLLKAAAEEFDVLISMDDNLPEQQKPPVL